MTRTATTLPSVWPTLVYRDSRAALRFLVDAFGFAEYAVHSSGDAVQHVELTWPVPDGGPAGGVMFGPADGDCDVAQPRFGMGAVHVVVTDPDRLYARAIAAGATCVREPEDTPFGSRQFVVRDPEGNTWSFGTWHE